MSATQLLYDFGKVKSSVDTQQAKLIVEQANVLVSIDDIAYQVASAVINIERYQRISQIGEQQVAGIQRILDIANLDQAILAWDLGRAVYLLSDFYLAGMITKEDALQRSLVICQKIQPLFNSWHDFNRSYIYGFRFWLYSTETELKLTADQNTIKIIEKLEKQAHSPFQLDWNMRLEKDW